MTIIDKSTGKEVENNAEKYFIDFGVIKKNSKASRTVQIKGDKLKNLTSQSDCSCTESSPNVIDKNTIEIDLNYKHTHLTNPFNKNVYLNFTEGEETKSAVINIKGQITL